MRVILVGKAGSGKDYFRDYLSKLEPLDVSYTTRPKREGEIPGYTYNYISKEDFLVLEATGFFLESVDFNGWHYGTSNENWNTKTVFIQTPSGTKCIPAQDKKNCVIVYFDIPIEIRRKRLGERSDFDSVERRIQADEKDFEGFTGFNIRVTDPMFDVESLQTTILSYRKCNNIV